MSHIPKVMMVGSAEESAGGVSTVIKLMKKMPVWEKYQCYWLGTQIQSGRWTKIRYALSAYLKSFFIMNKYDIIHFHTVPNISMLIQFPVFLFAKLYRKKIILHLHVCNQLAMEEYKSYKLAHWCMKKSDMIVLLANKAKRLLDENWKDINTSRCVIYNPCNDVASIPYSQHEKTILYAGRFTENKCGWLLIKAFSLIKNKYPEWKLNILGDGPEKAKYINLIKENELEDFVDMPGFLHGDELIRYYQKAGIYAMTSHYEGLPMVVVDAWSYGVPVISTRVGGLTDMIIEDKNGCFFSFDDAKEMSEKLERLMSNYDLREYMSKYSKNFSEQFSLNNISHSLDNLYKKI